MILFIFEPIPEVDVNSNANKENHIGKTLAKCLLSVNSIKYQPSGEGGAR